MKRHQLNDSMIWLPDGIAYLLKTIISLSFLLILTISTKSQEFTAEFKTLSINDGLPHSSVYSILQDKKGFMWFGTADGLCRYDGRELKTFKCNQSLLYQNVLKTIRGKLTEDKSGNIWYSNETGIYKWDHRTESVECIRAFLQQDYNNVAFESVFLDHGDNLWLLNLDEGIFKYNIISGMITRYPLPEDAVDYDIYYKYFTVDDDSNIWLKAGNENKPFIAFNMKSGKYASHFINNPPSIIIFDHNKRILVYQTELIYETSESTMTQNSKYNLVEQPADFNPCSGMRDSYNRLWIASRGNGLICYDENYQHIHEFKADYSDGKAISSDLLTCLYIDRNNNLWIGTDGGGISILDLKQPRFNIFPSKSKNKSALSNYFTKCFYEDESGRIWFGTHTNGLNIYNARTHVLKSYLNEQGKLHSLPGNIVGSILKDGDGNIWIGSSGGISVFNEEREYFNTILIHYQPTKTKYLSV